jgi:hypothetical protein
MFPATSYDPETLRLLTGAFEDAWRATQECLARSRWMKRASAPTWPSAS